MEFAMVFIVLAVIFGLYMTWGVGANDVANAMGTSVGSGALTLKWAIIVAAILEFGGACLVGQHVTGAIRKDILPFDAFVSMPDDYVFGMLGALLAAAVWLMAATYYGLPVSTTHTIVGAIVGFGLVALPDWSLIAWTKLGQILSSWIISPLLAGTLSFFVFTIIQRKILYQRDLIGSSRRVAPYFVFAVFFTLALVTLWKGLKPLNLDFGLWEAMGWASLLSLAMAVASIPLLRRIRVPQGAEASNPAVQNPVIGEELQRMESRATKLSAIATGDAQLALENLQGQLTALREQVVPKGPMGHDWGTPEFRHVEKIFACLQILSACAVAFAHGANDVANAVGPLSGVIHVLNEGLVSAETKLDPGVGMGILAVGGIGIVIGLATWGRWVIETVGKKITELTPTRGFSAEFGAAITILLASRLSLPISTTHTLVGAILGVGLARGVGALNLRVVSDIFISWVVTLPAGALLAILFYFILKAMFI